MILECLNKQKENGKIENRSVKLEHYMIIMSRELTEVMDFDSCRTDVSNWWLLNITFLMMKENTSRKITFLVVFLNSGGTDYRLLVVCECWILSTDLL